MTRQLRTRLAQSVGVLLALSAGSAAAAGLAQTAEGAKPKVAILVAGAAADDAGVIARAKATDADVRVAHSYADQLGVTHLLAARGYDRIITIGADKRIAIDPVAQRYPTTHFEIAG
jgi:hypothetical protein